MWGWILHTFVLYAQTILISAAWFKREEREHGRERDRWNAGEQINNGFLLFGENNSLARAGEVPFMA